MLEEEDEEERAPRSPELLRGEIARLRADMQRAASELRFEEAARLRDQLRRLDKLELRG